MLKRKCPTIVCRYELANTQLLQACSGRGCRGFRDFEVPLVVVTMSDGVTVESNSLDKALTVFDRPETTLLGVSVGQLLESSFLHAVVAADRQPSARISELLCEGGEGTTVER